MLRMKKIILIFSVVFYGSYLHAQVINFEWAKQFGGSLFDYGISLKTDAMGNVYSTGVFAGTVDFDPGSGVFNLTTINGSTDIYISKMDPAGNFIWAKHFDGSGDDEPRNIELDQSGNIYITGFIGDITDFDPGLGVLNLSPASDQTAFVSKLDKDGNLIWAKITAQGAAHSTGTSIKVDALGNVYSTGIFLSRTDFDPGPGLFEMTGRPSTYVQKLDVNGNFVWAKQIEDPPSGPSIPSSWGFSIVLDAAGNIYITGTFQSTADFDPGSGVYLLSSPHSIYIWKLDNNGNFVWAKMLGTSAAQISYSMVNDNSGNMYMTGYFSQTVDFDPGLGIYNLTSTGTNDIFVLKLSPDGDFIWVKQFGNTEEPNSSEQTHFAITLDNLGAIYITGIFIGTGDFDPGPGVFNLTSTGASDIYICKLNNNGDLTWAKSMGGVWYDYGFSINVDASKNIYTTGAFENTVDFDPGPGIYTLSSPGSTNIYVHKMSQCIGNTNSIINAAVCNSYVLNGHIYTNSGTYTQVIPNSAGCDSIITLNLIINRKFTSITASICEGQTYYAGGANQTTSGIYKDTLLTSLGCDSIITTTLTVNPKPKPDLGPDRNLCVSSAAIITPGTFNSYLWQDNSTQSNFTVNSIGTYWVTVTSANNCTATDSLKVLAIDTVPNNFLPPNQLICYGNEVKISVPGYKDYLWSTGSVSGNISLKDFGTFYLTVTDFNNCTGVDSIIISRANCIPIGIPNAFTPNGDGKNDVFKPTINQAIQYFSFEVFNRYGQRVFNTREYGTGWEGTYKGKKQPAGSYVYRIKFINIYGWESVNNGSVLLIR